MKKNLRSIRQFMAVSRDEAEVKSLLNTDIYKILMHNFLTEIPEWGNAPTIWKLIVRDPNVRLAEVIPIEALREQLDAARSIKGISEAEASYFRGMLLPNGERMLNEPGIQGLQNLQLPPYHIEEVDGGYEILFGDEFSPWSDSMQWEIPGLKIVNSLYQYYRMKNSGTTDMEANRFFNGMEARLYADIDTFRSEPGVTFSEFGTRRAFSNDWHQHVLQILMEELPNQCVGTSNVQLAMQTGSCNPKGTNAHELRMIPVALTPNDSPKEIIETMYDVDRKWGARYPGLRILLPDGFGTTFYLENCPEDIIHNHDGIRHDSKDPMDGIPEYLKCLEGHGVDSKKMVSIPSDGLNAQKSVDIWRAFGHHFKLLTFGIGTNLTNNSGMQIPMVIKPAMVWCRIKKIWVPLVKLSDNPGKATGDAARVEFMKKVYGTEGHVVQAVTV